MITDYFYKQKQRASNEALFVCVVTDIQSNPHWAHLGHYK